LAEVAVEVGLKGTALLTDALLNKGMAFSEAERTTFSLHGLLPPHVATLDEQVERQLLALRTYEAVLRVDRAKPQRDAAAGLYGHGRPGLPGVQPLLARRPVRKGCARLSMMPLPGLIAAKMWEPVYRPYRRKLGSGR
jgi:malate dehydrogenase (oxaloacetate-decarboxylating)